MYSVITEEASLRKNDNINVAITIQAFMTIRFYKLSGFCSTFVTINYFSMLESFHIVVPRMIVNKLKNNSRQSNYILEQL